MMGYANRIAAYKRQNKSVSITPKQRRRVQHKLGRYLNRKHITSVTTNKGGK